MNFPPIVPFDPDQATHASFLQAIQGNLLKFHGRPHTRLVFFRFNRRHRDNRKMLPAAVKAGFVTSAYEQRRQTKSGLRGERFFGLNLTKAFFDSANYGASADGATTLPQFPVIQTREEGDWWELPYWDIPDGFWLLAHQDAAELDAMQADVEGFLAKNGAGPYARPEQGFVWSEQHPDAHGEKIVREPFGFRDGLSDAVFMEPAGSPPLPPNQIAHGQLAFDQVLIDRGAHEGGSLIVLAKLQQNVAAFRAFELLIRQAYVAAGKPAPSEPGALLVGRGRDGQPLGTILGADLNDFNFAPGQASRGCPFHAHIRKANPRASDTTHPTPVQGAQFARRSVVYDSRGQLPKWASADYPEGAKITGDVGLLFMGYMSDFGAQFDTMFNNWFGSGGFPYRFTGMKDPLLRAGAKGERVWSWDGVTLDKMERFVKSRGMLKCYVPSLTWLLRQ